MLSEVIWWVERFGKDEQGRPRDGFYPELGKMITGAGWLSIGPGYRHRLWNDRASMDASAAISWRGYKVVQGTFELPHLADDRLTIGSQVQWQDFTQVRFFGRGADSLETSATDYRVQATDFVTYADWRLPRSVWVTGGLGILSRPGISSSTGPFDRADPDTVVVFPSEPGADGRQPRYVHGDAAVLMDTRDHPSYPRRGGLYRATFASYRDRGDGSLSFTRFEAEAAQFMPVVKNRGVFAVRWWIALSDTAADANVPFYMLPSLGGSNTLRGFADYRFHDRHLMVVNAESRWAIWPHVDAAAFFDAGSIAARVDDLGFSETSAGAGLRLHTGNKTLMRFEVARSHEGWRFLFKLGDPLRLARVARRTAALPFVP